jgi:multidrug efflux pump subunit AcrA (membrane-fusion protein)
MAGTIEKLQTVNSLIRTLLALGVFGGLGAAGWYGYTTYNAAEIEGREKDAALEAQAAELDRIQQQVEQQHQELAAKEDALRQQQAKLAQQQTEIDDLTVEVKQQAVEIERLDTALRLHKLERRLALIRVLDTGVDEDTGRKFSKIEFLEQNELGDPVGEAKQFQLDGEMIYVDYWVVKFDDKYVEQADLERGVSICMFHRIFGDSQNPKDGFSLDEPGQRPGSYARGSVMSDLEQKIWSDFWTIANDPQRAAELGIRALHGDAVSIKVDKGKVYRITVRASAGPEITVETQASSGQAGT